MNENNGVIDSLLVSLGMDVDDKSFKEASSVVSDLRSSLLQLAAVAGTGLGLKEVTFGLSSRINEMQRLSKETGFAVKQIEALQYALKRVGVYDENAAYGIAQRIASLQWEVDQGKLREDAFRSEVFSPTRFKDLTGNEAIRYLVDAYGRMNYSEKTYLRSGLGLGQNDPLTRLMELGGQGFDRVMSDFDRLYQAQDPSLVENAAKLNDELADLSQNFNNLQKRLGEDLLPVVNAFLEIINKFMEEHPDMTRYLAYAAAGGGALAALKTAGKVVTAGAAGVTGMTAGGGLSARSLFSPWWLMLYSKKLNKNESDFFRERDALLYEQLQREQQGYEPEQHAQMAKVPQRTGGADITPPDVQTLFSGLEEKYRLPAGLLNATYQKESGGGKHLVSPKGALGPFQFMPATAAEQGLYGDDVMDTEKSADAAARYYRKLLDHYHGDLTRSVAAYNYGMGNVDRKGLKNLPKETRDYIPAILSGLDDESFMKSYYAPQNRQGAYRSWSSTSRYDVNQTNNVVINAGHADAQETARLVSDSSERQLTEAISFLDTDKY